MEDPQVVIEQQADELKRKIIAAGGAGAGLGAMALLAWMYRTKKIPKIKAFFSKQAQDYYIAPYEQVMQKPSFLEGFAGSLGDVTRQGLDTFLDKEKQQGVTLGESFNRAKNKYLEMSSRQKNRGERMDPTMFKKIAEESQLNRLEKTANAATEVAEKAGGGFLEGVKNFGSRAGELLSGTKSRSLKAERGAYKKDLKKQQSEQWKADGKDPMQFKFQEDDKLRELDDAWRTERRKKWGTRGGVGAAGYGGYSLLSGDEKSASEHLLNRLEKTAEGVVVEETVTTTPSVIRDTAVGTAAGAGLGGMVGSLIGAQKGYDVRTPIVQKYEDMLTPGRRHPIINGVNTLEKTKESLLNAKLSRMNSAASHSIIGGALGTSIGALSGAAIGAGTYALANHLYNKKQQQANEMAEQAVAEQAAMEQMASEEQFERLEKTAFLGSAINWFGNNFGKGNINYARKMLDDTKSPTFEKYKENIGRFAEGLDDKTLQRHYEDYVRQEQKVIAETRAGLEKENSRINRNRWLAGGGVAAAGGLGAYGLSRSGPKETGTEQQAAYEQYLLEKQANEAIEQYGPSIGSHLLGSGGFGLAAGGGVGTAIPMPEGAGVPGRASRIGLGAGAGLGIGLGYGAAKYGWEQQAFQREMLKRKLAERAAMEQQAAYEQYMMEKQANKPGFFSRAVGTLTGSTARKSADELEKATKLVADKKQRTQDVKSKVQEYLNAPTKKGNVSEQVKKQRIMDLRNQMKNSNSKNDLANSIKEQPGLAKEIRSGRQDLDLLNLKAEGDARSFKNTWAGIGTGVGVTGAGVAGVSALRGNKKEASEVGMDELYKEAAMHILNEEFPEVPKYKDPMQSIRFDRN
jgi:outer membrane lipoprotein SlyB